MPDRKFPVTEFDASRPHVARVYDYLLGGKDNFAADRAVGDQMIASLPAVQVGVRAQRDVLGRVVHYLVNAQIMDLFDGLELVEPGLVPVPEWRPDPGTPGVHDHPVLQMACVGVAQKTRKP